MKFIGLLLGIVLASASCLRAQVTVEVTLDQEQFLPGEAIPAKVRITNRSGQTLHFGPEEGWLRFAIESREGFIVRKHGDVPAEGEFSLDSSKVAKVRPLDLAPYFSLSTPGRYTITATVLIRDWNQQVVSAPMSFDIIDGAKMWEQEVGLPNAENRVPELRRYTLQQANYLGKHLMLYVRITDAKGKIYKVFPIGPMLSFGQPEPQVDKISNLHILYQNGPRSFNYVVITPDGDVIVRQTYDFTTRPRLRVNQNGDLTVVGGTRRITSRDVPAPKSAENNGATQKP